MDIIKHSEYNGDFKKNDTLENNPIFDLNT